MAQQLTGPVVVTRPRSFWGWVRIIILILYRFVFAAIMASCMWVKIHIFRSVGWVSATFAKVISVFSAIIVGLVALVVLVGIVGVVILSLLRLLRSQLSHPLIFMWILVIIVTLVLRATVPAPTAQRGRRPRRRWSIWLPLILGTAITVVYGLSRLPAIVWWILGVILIVGIAIWAARALGITRQQVVPHLKWIAWVAAGVLVVYGLYSWRQEYNRSPKVVLERTVGEGHPLVAIAGCVSNFRQFNDDGSIYVGPGNGVGLLQIPPQYINEVKKGGDDPNTVVGNIQGSKKLHHVHGALPWMTNKSEVDCWSRQLQDFRVFMNVGNVLTDSIPVPIRYDFVITKVSGEGLMIQIRDDLELVPYDNTVSVGYKVEKLRFWSAYGAVVDVKFHRPR